MVAAVKPAWLIAGGIAAAALAFVALRNAGAIGRNLGGAAVDMVDGVVSGVVVGIGERVGVPATDATACAAAQAAGDTWEASFACPASDFLSWYWRK